MNAKAELIKEKYFVQELCLKLLVSTIAYFLEARKNYNEGCCTVNISNTYFLSLQSFMIKKQ